MNSIAIGHGTRSAALAALIALGLAAAGCQSGPPQISIEGARAELSPAVFGEAMVTLKIVNLGGADALHGVRTNIPGANASIHVMEGKSMVRVDMMRVAEKRTLDLKMGGDHIMIENIPRTFREGTTFTLTLVFQTSKEMQVPLTLQKAAVTSEDGHRM